MSDDSKILVTKMEAAKRQLRTAIRLWFEDGDPVAIHTIVAAAHEIVHTLFRRRGLKDPLLYDSDMIKDEYRKDWAQMVKSHATFFKHAQRDPEGVIEFSPYTNEVFILFSLRALNTMAEPLGVEEHAFAHWITINRPEMVKREAAEIFPVDVLKYIRSLNKREFLDGFLRDWNRRNPS